MAYCDDAPGPKKVGWKCDGVSLWRWGSKFMTGTVSFEFDRSPPFKTKALLRRWNSPRERAMRWHGVVRSIESAPDLECDSDGGMDAYWAGEIEDILAYVDAELGRPERWDEMEVMYPTCMSFGLL